MTIARYYAMAALDKRKLSSGNLSLMEGIKPAEKLYGERLFVGMEESVESIECRAGHWRETNQSCVNAHSVTMICSPQVDWQSIVVGIYYSNPEAKEKQRTRLAMAHLAGGDWDTVDWNLLLNGPEGKNIVRNQAYVVIALVGETSVNFIAEKLIDILKFDAKRMIAYIRPNDREIEQGIREIVGDKPISDEERAPLNVGKGQFQGFGINALGEFGELLQIRAPKRQKASCIIC